MKTDPFLEEHPVKLTEAEINDRSREAVRLVAELDALAETVRLDTHAIVSTRAMTAAEISEARQAQMFPDDELAGRRKKKSPTH